MVLKRLREETREHHLRVERCFDLDSRLVGVAGYRELLERLAGIYAVMEKKLEELEWGTVAIDFAKRRKLEWLREDLKVLGSEMKVEERGEVVQVRSLAEGFGCLYVMEGATLGGQVICRMVRQRLGLEAATGMRFFTSYGEEVGRMWKEFGGAISARCVSDEEVAAAVRGAVETFEFFARELERD